MQAPICHRSGSASGLLCRFRAFRAVRQSGDVGGFPEQVCRFCGTDNTIYAAATASYGLSVWTDAQNATVCGPVQSYRAASLAAGTLALPAPWPLADCPGMFGNTDIWSATTG